MRPEARLQRDGTDHVVRRGGYATVNTCPPCDVGTPDVHYCYRGCWLSVEYKADGSDPDRAQREQLFRVARAGGWAIVARSVADVAAVLDRIDAWLAEHPSRRGGHVAHWAATGAAPTVPPNPRGGFVP